MLASLLFAVISIFIVGALFSSLLQNTKVKSSPDSFLVLDLSMNLTDRPNDFGLEDLTRQTLTNQSTPPQLHLLEVLKALSKAREDPMIKGIFVKGGFIPNGFGCGYQAIRELLVGLNDFKQSKKPVIGFISNPSQLDYLIYSNCDKLFMDPSGSLLMRGLTSEQIFLAESFEKFGIGMQVVRVGDYKGAVEPYTSSEYSEENRMQISRLLKTRWTDYLSCIADGRAIDVLELEQSLQSQFLFQPKQAIELGLVDESLPYDEMIDYLCEAGASAEDDDGFRNIDLIDYLDRIPSKSPEANGFMEGTPKIKIIYVEGTIVDGWVDNGVSVGGKKIAARLREARFDENCKAIVLRINSPGGSVTGSDAILHELRRVRRENIPVVVSMGSVAASGGYWIATECDHLFAGRQTITGSIGVFGLLPNFKDLAISFGIRWDSVNTHPHSNLLSVSRPKSPEELLVIQNYIESLYDQFIELVAIGRDLPKNEVEKIASGRVWVGTDAKKIGLIDNFGGIEDAIQKAAEIARLKDDFEIQEIPGIKTPIQVIEKLLDTASGYVLPALEKPPTGVSSLTREIESLINHFSLLNDPNQAYGLLPWYRRNFGFSE